AYGASRVRQHTRRSNPARQCRKALGLLASGRRFLKTRNYELILDRQSTLLGSARRYSTASQNRVRVQARICNLRGVFVTMSSTSRRALLRSCVDITPLMPRAPTRVSIRRRFLVRHSVGLALVANRPELTSAFSKGTAREHLRGERAAAELAAPL